MSTVYHRPASSWDRKTCPGCRRTGKVRSEGAGSAWQHTCDRCDISWTSDEPIDEVE